jgi:hypothetical protein
VRARSYPPAPVLDGDSRHQQRTSGATLGDFLTKAPAKGGLGFGTIGSSATLAITLAVLVAFAIRNTLRERPAVPAITSPSAGA